MNKVIIFLFAVIFPQLIFAQSIATDSKGKDVFNFYKTNTLSLPISSSNSSLKIGYSFGFGKREDTSGKQFYVQQYSHRQIKADSVLTDTVINNFNLRYKRPGTPTFVEVFDSSNFTVAKSWSLNISINASNLGKNLSQIFKSHPSFGASIGISNNIDVFNNWDQIQTLVLRQRPYIQAFTFNINRDNTFLYDTLLKTQSRKTPFTYAFQYEGTYFPWYGLAMSFSASYQLGWNLDDLKKYQTNEPFYLDQNVISLGELVGKLGDLNNKNIVRFRISLPLFTDPLKSHSVTTSESFIQKITDLCIVPYYTFYGQTNTKFNRQFGVFIDLLGKRFSFRNGSVISAGGLGVDWINSKDKWSKANVFASGTIDIVSLIQHGKGSKQTQKTAR